MIITHDVQWSLGRLKSANVGVDAVDGNNRTAHRCLLTHFGASRRRLCVGRLDGRWEVKFGVGGLQVILEKMVPDTNTSLFEVRPVWRAGACLA